jgi:protein O-GlcNAc transferase
MATGANSLQMAMDLHQAGQLAQAEQLYRQILRGNPRHPDALHLLGLIAHQAGQHETAIGTMSQAIAIDGAQPFYHGNLGEAYRALGRTAEARACYERALQLDPMFGAAHYNLGLLLEVSRPAEAQRHFERSIGLQPDFSPAYTKLGNVLRAQAKPAEAVEAYRVALRCQPADGEALNNLAVALVDLKRFPEALASLEQALRVIPHSADVHANLGNAYCGVKDWDQAVRCYQEALRLRPNLIEARHALGNVFTIQGDLVGAAAAYIEVLRLKPDHVETLNQYGDFLQVRGQIDEALELYERALRARPESAAAHYNRANVLILKRMHREAIAGFQEALRLRPDFPEAYANLAILLNETSRPDEALETCRRALERGADCDKLPGIMANSLLLLGRGEEAIEYYRKSIALLPDKPDEYSNLLYALNFMPDYDPSVLLTEHLQWARQYAEPLTAQAPPHDNDRKPRRRLRIGYLSPDFRNNAVNFFVEPLLVSHDHKRFEIFCYSTTLYPDETTARLQAAADHWRDARHQTDEQIAALVREDKIDILVDLSGHMGRRRLLVFARKPAPIQVTYLGYQNTTGMSAMDYRITDQRADPAGLTDRFYTEKLVRLPRAFFCYQPCEAPPITRLPALESGTITFGSFNNFAKVTPRVIDAWLEILKRVPSSRLLILAFRGGSLERRLCELAQQRGISPERVELHDKLPRQDYLRLIQQADIALDPFPFNGHTTICDSIWMGVPVVMLQGQSYASRFGGSVLANLGLEKWIANSVDDYVDLAVKSAADLPRLSKLRNELRPRMADSALLDFPGFARNLEKAYRQMWLDWCRQAKAKK